jgi:hypothetical protein
MTPNAPAAAAPASTTHASRAAAWTTAAAGRIAGSWARRPMARSSASTRTARAGAAPRLCSRAFVPPPPKGNGPLGGPLQTPPYPPAARLPDPPASPGQWADRPATTVLQWHAPPPQHIPCCTAAVFRGRFPRRRAPALAAPEAPCEAPSPGRAACLSPRYSLCERRRASRVRPMPAHPALPPITTQHGAQAALCAPPRAASPPRQRAPSRRTPATISRARAPCLHAARPPQERPRAPGCLRPSSLAPLGPPGRARWPLRAAARHPKPKRTRRAPTPPDRWARIKITTLLLSLVPDGAAHTTAAHV